LPLVLFLPVFLLVSLLVLDSHPDGCWDCCFCFYEEYFYFYFFGAFLLLHHHYRGGCYVEAERGMRIETAKVILLQLPGEDEKEK